MKIGSFSSRSILLLLVLVLLTLTVLVSETQARGTGGVTPQTRPVVLAAAAQADPHTHKLDIGVLAFRSSKAVSVEFRGRVHKMKVFKRSKANTTWIWRSNYAFKSGRCYDYRVIVTTAKGTRSVNVSSKAKGNNSSYCSVKKK